MQCATVVNTAIYFDPLPTPQMLKTQTQNLRDFKLPSPCK
jgi:hypothetical protein